MVSTSVRINSYLRWMTAFGSRFRSSRDGVTAIEFAFVAFPFTLFVLGIMAVGLQFFTVNALDNAVETASRKIRTGEAQRAGMKLSEFKSLVCQSGGDYIEADCDNVYVHVQSAGSWGDDNLVPQPCAQNGQMTAQANMTKSLVDYSGGAEQVVLVTVCYDWRLPIKFPYLQYMMMRPRDNIPLASGGSLIQSVATFRTEPYE